MKAYLFVLYVLFVAGSMLGNAVEQVETKRVPALEVAGDVAEGWGGVPNSRTWKGYVKGGRQLGAWNTDSQEVWVIDPITGEWQKVSDVAWSARDAEHLMEIASKPGLDWQKVQKEIPGYKIGSRSVTESDAMTALKPNPALPNDAALPSLTVIGEEGDCKPVSDAIKGVPALQALRNAFLFQCYRPADAMVAKYGFVTDGKPSIYFQDAAGRVLWRADSYPGADTLAEAIAVALEQCPPPRKPQPDYQPIKDPDPARIIRPLTAHSVWWEVCKMFVAAIVGMFLLGGLLVAAVVLVLVTRWGLRKVKDTPPAAADTK